MKTIFWKAVFSLTLMVGLLFSGVSLVFGVQAPGLTAGTTSRMNASYGGAGTAYSAQAGNVTQIDLSGKQITTHWAGFYGNVSGNITLEDSSGNVFYDWVGLGTPVGEVYASNTSVVSWSSIGCANGANMTALNSFLGMAPATADSVFNTYDVLSHGGFSVAGKSITANSCNSTNAYTNTGANAGLFQQVLLADNSNIPVFATILNASATSFRSTPIDFELLAGVPSTGTLYFFIELG